MSLSARPTEKTQLENFDVVIIGAGLAGLQLARLLARSGDVRVLLVDRKRTLDEAIHTIGIFVRRTLEDFDLPESCLGAPVRHVALYSPSRRRVLRLESPHEEFRVGRMKQLYARYLEEALRDGAEWSPATRYVGSEALTTATAESATTTTKAHGSVVHLESGGRAWSVRARVLVGGDGAQSRVARDLGLDLNREWIVGVEDVWRGVPLAGAPPCFHCFLDTRLAPGYLAWVVNDGEETHLGVGGYAARFDPVRALEEFRASVEGMFDFSRAEKIERRGGRIPVGGVLRRIACERGLLIGDAAGAVSPLTAGGLDPCLRLSSLAASVIADYVATNDTATLARYEGEKFRARFASRLWMRRVLSGIRQPALLELACASLRLAPLKPLAWHVFFGRGSFPDVAAESALQRAARRATI